MISALRYVSKRSYAGLKESRLHDIWRGCKLGRLQNGVRVATFSERNALAAAGMFVMGGPGSETKQTRGYSHLLSKLLFQDDGSKHFTTEQRSKLIDRRGGVINCSYSHDVMYSTCLALDTVFPDTFRAMVDGMIHPVLSQSNISTQLNSLYMDRLQIESNSKMVMPDLLRGASFQRDGASLSVLQSLPSSPNHTLSVTPKDLSRFLSDHFTSTNDIVLVSCGVPHDMFMRLVSESPLASLTPSQHSILSHSSWSSGSLAVNPSDMYCGGPDSWIGVGWEGVSAGPHLYAQAVWGKLLGGGSSFSVGGPGKGLFARMYTDVLNRVQFANHAEAYVDAINRKQGIAAVFGASSDITNMRSLRDLLVTEAMLMAVGDVSDEELTRAKTQLLASILFSSEDSTALLMEAAHELLLNNKLPAYEEIVNGIESITIPDVAAYSRRLLNSPPSIAIFGDTKAIMAANGNDVCDPAPLESAIKRALDAYDHRPK